MLYIMITLYIYILYYIYNIYNYFIYITLLYIMIIYNDVIYNDYFHYLVNFFFLILQGPLAGTLEIKEQLLTINYG